MTGTLRKWARTLVLWSSVAKALSPHTCGLRRHIFDTGGPSQLEYVWKSRDRVILWGSLRRTLISSCVG